jgi:uncharacterized membrane protein
MVSSDSAAGSKQPVIAYWTAILCGLSAIASALVAGVFLTFSDFVMRALAKAEPAAGLEAMQIINREVFRSVFMALLLGMSALAPAFALIKMSGPAALFIILAGSLYLSGVFAVTLLFNVPMNNRLDRQLHTSAEAQAYWQFQFYPRWTLWNHVRTIAAGASAISYMLACITLVHAV